MADVMDAAAQQAVPDTLPIVEGRRTLIIGIGSTGAKVANQLLERLTWTYADPNNVPWVRCLVLETQKAPASHPVNTNARFIHLTIDENQYSGLISNPEMYRGPLDFSSWNIPALTAGTDAIKDGANNTRLLGRLSLLFPSNFNLLMNAVTTELSNLQNLNTDQATAKFNRSQDGEEVRVRLSNELYVYVVGTLCGGTASGCFIDLGYILQSLSGYRLNTSGIFLLPSATHDDNIQLGNAYAALVELNHFSSNRVRYKAQYPNQPGHPYEASTWGTRPYRNLYLVQGRGAAAEAYAKLITASADYIYTDVIGSNAGVRDGDRTNISNFFIQRDFWGATQTFFTMGLSSIEFPYAKVAKACCLRLARLGFKEMAGGEPLVEVQRNQLMERLPLINSEKMIARLLTREGASLSHSIALALENARAEALNNDQAMALIKEQLDGTFEGTETPLMQLPSRIVPQTIEDNARQAGVELQDTIIKTGMEMVVSDAPKGLQMLASYLKTVEDTLTNNLKDTGTSTGDAVAELRAAATNAMDRTRDCREDFFVGLTVSRSVAVRRYVDEFMEISANLYDQWCRHECAPISARIYGETLRMVQKFRARLEDPACGLLTEVTGIVGKMDALYKVTDVRSGSNNSGWSRSINGIELFEPGPGNTVDQEYSRCLAETRTLRKITGDEKTAEMKLALDSVQPYMKEAMQALFADTNTIGRLDPGLGKKVPNFDEGQIVKMALPALPAFEPLKRRTIIERLMSSPNRETYINSAGQDARIFLDWRQGHPRYYEHPRKAYGYVFYNDRDALAPQLQQNLQEMNLLGGLNNIRAMSMSDPHQILFLNERGAFSLGTIESLLDEQASTWRITYQNPPGLPSLHARADISEWISWGRIDDENRRHIRMVFLAAIATGVIKSPSITRYEFHYPKKSPADPGVVIFTNDIDESALVIRKRAILADIELDIQRFRDATSAGEVVKRLVDFIPTSAGKYKEGGQLLGIEDVEAYLLDYIFNDDALQKIYTDDFYKDQVVLSCRRPDANGKEAYYCPQCNRVLGYSVEALFRDDVVDGRPVRVRKCSYFDCQKPIG